MSQNISLFEELKRRNVFRVAVAYVVLAWLVMQVADVVINNIAAPDWVFKVLLLFLILGLPLAIFFAWAFEITPEGLKRESEVDRSQSITPATGRKLDRMIIVFLIVALGYFAVDKFFLSAGRQEAAVEAALQQAGQESAVDRQAQLAAPAAAPSQATAADNTIAVLPFVNMSSDPEQEYFSDGLSEELLNLLAKIPQLQVAARTSAFSFKGKDVRIDEVARELKVAHVLEGSVRSSGERIRVTAQLIRADNGFHLWSETFDRTLDDVFAIQDEIAGAVVEALKVTLLGDAPHVAETTPEAYALFLQAKHLSNQLTNENFEKAVAMYQQVLALDPNYAPAWVGLSRNYRNMMVTGQYPEEEGVRLATDAVDRALALDPNLAEAHARKALLQLENLEDHASAALSYRRAMELNPNDPSALIGVANFHSFLGDHVTAIELANSAVQRDPVDALSYLTLSEFLRLAGRQGESKEALGTAINLSPELYSANYRMGIAHLIDSRLDESEAAFSNESDHEYQLKGMALVAHARGDGERFQTLLEQLIDQYGAIWPSEIAHVLAWTGDVDGAFEWLDRAVAIGEGGINGSHQEVLLTPLHGDPRWQPYLESIGISEAQLATIRESIGW